MAGAGVGAALVCCGGRPSRGGGSKRRLAVISPEGYVLEAICVTFWKSAEGITLS